MYSLNLNTIVKKPIEEMDTFIWLLRFFVKSANVLENPGWSREGIEIHAVRKDYYGGIASMLKE